MTFEVEIIAGSSLPTTTVFLTQTLPNSPGSYDARSRTESLFANTQHGEAAAAATTTTTTTTTIKIINCSWVVTRWQWLFYMYTKYEIVY